ncbi:hypothetical protein V0U79_00010 [Hyphobacterium sp. HN65]|uniref:Uncharacterized protein n=1 Tax=Hyphobacterium lacteum TaxID=3116575 RepID=A0ABU7LLC3_9PROT|nr:hypothetical protein [Hyphobacterium sp. HN65]MEE2524733.1 hypothetical protein [Hyphobacterium sp. HN65]
MILANLAKALRTQNWFAVLVEFLIVIAGVVIGFQITAWNADRAEREIGREYVVRLQGELEANRDQLEYNIAYADWVRGHTIAALDALRGDPAGLDEDFIVDAYIAGHGIGVRVQADTFDELLSTGAFQTIPDADVRQSLVRFYRIAENSESFMIDVGQYQSALRRAMPYDVITRLRAVCSAVFEVDEQGSTIFNIPDTCPPDLSSQEFDEAIQSLLAADLVPELRESLALIEVKTVAFLRVGSAAADALAALERLE